MRLFTRADLDGIVCAALLKQHEPVDEVIFVHPKEMQDGNVDVQPGDAIANLPFHKNAAIWFDHHVSGEASLPEGVRGSCTEAPSAARLVYRFYNFSSSENSEQIRVIIDETDKLDSAQLSYENVLHPDGWILLGFVLDPRTGIQLDPATLKEVIKAISDGNSIGMILELPAIKQATERYIAEEEQNKILLVSNTKLKRNIIINDLRNVDHLPAGNRFTIYAIFPRCSINIRLFKHETHADKVVVAVGKSIYYRNHPMHIGTLMQEYGGGGLDGAGSCQFYSNEVDSKLKELTSRLLI